MIVEIAVNKAVALSQNLTLTGNPTNINALAFSLDSSYLVSLGILGDVYFWNATENFFFINKFSFSNCYALVPLPNAQLASGCSNSWSGDISILSSSGIEISRLTGHASPVRSLALSPDTSLLASGSDDATIKLWKYQNQTTALMTLYGTTASVISVVFVSDKVLASRSLTDNSIKVWNVNASKKKKCFFSSLLRL